MDGTLAGLSTDRGCESGTEQTSCLVHQTLHVRVNGALSLCSKPNIKEFTLDFCDHPHLFLIPMKKSLNTRTAKIRGAE